jgi:tetratricopeptide (TPR) repeat protein
MAYAQALSIILGVLSVVLALSTLFPSDLELQNKESLGRIEDALTQCDGFQSLDDANFCLARKGITTDDIDRYISIYKESSDKNYELALAYISQGNYQDAILNMRLSLGYGLSNNQAYLYLALLYYNLEEYEQSIDYCEKYLDEVPWDMTCAHTIVLSNVMLERLEPAMHMYGVILPILENETAQALSNLAVLQGKLGHFEEAKDAAYKASVLKPSSCNLANVGYYFAHICNREKAEEYYAQAYEVDPAFCSNCFSGGETNIPDELQDDFMQWGDCILPVQLNCSGGAPLVSECYPPN